MINYYYADALTHDTEGNLVKLCDACAAQHADQVQLADSLEDGDTPICELCSPGMYPLALTPARALLEQQYQTTCDARDGAATCIATYDQVKAQLDAAATDLRQQLEKIDNRRHTLAYYLRHLENEYSDYMTEAYALFTQLYRG